MAAIAKGVFGFLGISGITYGALVYSDVVKAEKVVLEKKTLAEFELGRKQGVQQRIKDTEGNAEVLMKDCNSLQQRLSQADTDLQTAKAELVRLEDLRSETSKEQTQKQGQLQSTLANIASLQKDYFRHSEAHTIAEKEHQAAQKKARELMQQRNPLPQIQRWLGQ